MSSHHLKCWNEFHDAIRRGEKTFEVRKNDRDFQVGDVLRLHRFDPETQTFSSSVISRLVTYIMHGPAFGIEAGYCVMSHIQADEIL